MSGALSDACVVLICCCQKILACLAQVHVRCMSGACPVLFPTHLHIFWLQRPVLVRHGLLVLFGIFLCSAAMVPTASVRGPLTKVDIPDMPDLKGLDHPLAGALWAPPSVPVPFKPALCVAASESQPEPAIARSTHECGMAPTLGSWQDAEDTGQETEFDVS